MNLNKEVPKLSKRYAAALEADFHGANGVNDSEMKRARPLERASRGTIRVFCIMTFRIFPRVRLRLSFA